MDQLSQLGIELPSVAYIIGTVLLGLVGMVARRHGRRTSRPRDDMDRPGPDALPLCGH